MPNSELVAEIVKQCGDDVWGSCAQYPVSSWKMEVEEGNTMLGYWQFVISSAEADGVNLDDLRGEAGRADEIDAVARRYGWSPVELRHARDNLGNDYGSECVIPLANGRALHLPAYPSPCYYVRVTHQGYELGYWTSDELREDAELTLGAILGAAKGAGPAKLGDGLTELPEFSVTEIGDHVIYRGVIRTDTPGSDCPFEFTLPFGSDKDQIEDAASDAAFRHVNFNFAPVPQ